MLLERGLQAASTRNSAEDSNHLAVSGRPELKWPRRHVPSTALQFCLLLLGLLLLPACSHLETPGAKTDATQRRTLTPVVEPIGKVVAVRAELRFLVADFFLSESPKIEQRLGVYREGRKVGEVKITGPERDKQIAADIIAGEAKVGDEVRPD